MVLPSNVTSDGSSDETDEPSLPAIQPDDITVAIFCALAYESVAVRYAFDEELWCSPQTTGRQNYVFSFGRIAQHKIVIARPTQMGPVNTAQCAATVSQQFPNVRLALMVGIGAGIPSDNTDIRLGDVVVSVPDEDHPGVLEYDFGKYEADGEFVRKGSLNSPPRILLSAIGSLEEDELMGKTPIKRMLKPITKQSGYKRPQSGDILFEPTFPHVRKGSDCTDCQASPEMKIVHRDERESPVPVTHRGLILSGSGVIKNPEDREKLRRGYHSAICFEMEAAGIMNEIPCLVIRGICDYADTHKQDGWHFYAAATAAAYCKAVLHRVPAQEVMEILPMKEMMQKVNVIHEIVQETYKNTQALQANDHLSKIRTWLSPPDPSTNLNKAREQHFKGTSQWFLDSNQYTEWKTTRNSFLWLNGIPGCGKTILSSSVVVDLQQDSACTCLLYFYFDFNDKEKQLLEKCIRSLIVQLYNKHEDTRTEVDNLYLSHDEGGLQPNAMMLRKLLHSMVQKAGRVWLILDALDECDPEDRSSAIGLLPWIRSFRDCDPSIHILVTSRPEYDITIAISKWSREEDVVPLQSSKVEADIEAYVKAKTNEMERWRNHPDVRKEVENTLIQKADGMFRWVSCQFDILKDCSHRQAVLKELANLPRTLDATYARILARVPPEHLADTTRLLQFLAYSERPLTLDEAVDALAVDSSGQRRFDPADRFVIPEEAAKYCTGLVAIVKKEKTKYRTTVLEIQLAHFSVQEYLTSNRLEGGLACRLQETAARASIVTICLLYLQDLHRSRVGWEARKEYPFVQYCASYWAAHAAIVERSGTKGLSIVWEYLSAKEAYEFGRQFDIPNDFFLELPHYRCEPLASLCYASARGLIHSVRYLLENGADVHARSGKNGDALHAALYRGHTDVLQLLLESGAGFDTNTLQVASSLGYTDIVRLLVEKGADVTMQGGLHSNALQAACSRGHTDVVRLLLEKGAGIDAERGDYGDLLRVAAYEGYSDIVQLLLEKGADINAQGEDYGDPLQAASYGGHIDVVRLLLGKGFTIDALSGSSSNALQAASAQGYGDIVLLLLENGADVNAQGGCFSNPLQAASYGGCADIVQLLLEKGADVATHGAGALQTATIQGHSDVIQLLLEQGACTDTSCVVWLLREEAADLNVAN